MIVCLHAQYHAAQLCHAVTLYKVAFENTNGLLQYFNGNRGGAIGYTLQRREIVILNIGDKGENGLNHGGHQHRVAAVTGDNSLHDFLRIEVGKQLDAKAIA